MFNSVKVCEAIQGDHCDQLKNYNLITKEFYVRSKFSLALLDSQKNPEIFLILPNFIFVKSLNSDQIPRLPLHLFAELPLSPDVCANRYRDGGRGHRGTGGHENARCRARPGHWPATRPRRMPSKSGMRQGTMRQTSAGLIRVCVERHRRSRGSSWPCPCRPR